jgi:hypothetical protein
MMSSAAFADGFHHDRGRGHGPWHGPWHEHPRYHRGVRVFIAPPPHVVYVAPPPVIYMPAPVPSAPPVAANPASPVYQAQDGRYCREYQATIDIDGQPRPSYGTVCMQPDGTWRIVD